MTNSEIYLQKRFDLFEKYCFPSIINQNNKEFVWFVLFRDNLPYRLKQRVEYLKKSFKNFYPIYFPLCPYDEVKPRLIIEINKFLDKNDKFIISTRIDNDDAFHNEMIEEIQKNFISENNVFLNFNYGYHYDSIKRIWFKMKFENNHFISKIENISHNPNTVISYDHSYINKYGKVIEIDNRDKPMWMEIIHNNNICNFSRFTNYTTAKMLWFPLFSSIKFKKFGFSKNPSLT